MKLPFRALVFMDHSLCWCCSWALHLWEASLGWLNFPFYFLDDVHLIFTIVHWQHERALSTWLDTVEDKENPNMVPCGCNHQFSLFLSLYVVLGITSSLHTNLGKKEVRNLGFDSYLVKALIWNKDQKLFMFSYLPFQHRDLSTPYSIKQSFFHLPASTPITTPIALLFTPIFFPVSLVFPHSNPRPSPDLPAC